MIVVDDASTDESPAIVREYSNADPRIRLFSFEKNKGIAQARNYGISMAKGKYLSFLDSDDKWEPNKLEYQLKVMVKNQFDFTFTGCSFISDSGEWLGKGREAPGRVNFSKLLKGNVIPCSSVMYCAENITVRMPELKHEDYAAWLDVLKDTPYAYGINKKLLIYRLANSSVSKNKWKTLGWTWNIFYRYQKLGLIRSVTSMSFFIVNTIIKYCKN